jgi:hypothetical protein
LTHSLPITAILANPAHPGAMKTYAKIKYEDGDWCICEPGAVADMTEGCQGFDVAEVQMTGAEFEALPEFNG